MAENLTINAGAQLPEFERKKTWDKTGPSSEVTSETVAQSPERQAADIAEQAAGQHEVTAAKEEQDYAKAAGGINRDLTQQTSDINAHSAADQDFALNNSADLIAAARERTKARQAELDAMDSPSLFGNTDGHGKVMRGIAVALGGIGDAMQRAAMVRIGKSPPTIDTVGQIINGILDQQREHIGKLKDSVVMARTGEKDAVEARQQMLADVDLRGATMLKRAKSLAEARLAALGKTPDEIAADKNVAALDAKIAEKHSAYVAPLLEKTSNILKSSVSKVGGEETNRVPGKAQGAAPTGATAEQSAALAKYVDEHPNASQGDLVGVAKSIGIPDAQGEVTRVAGTNSLPEKERERQTTDLEGKPVLAPSARNVGAVSEQVASTQRAVRALDDLKEEINKPGLLPNALKAAVPGTDLNRKKEEVVGLMAPAMGMTLSDARQHLDEHIVGTGGVGLLGGDAAGGIDRLKQQVQAFGETKIKGMTTPVRAPVAPAAREAAPAPRAVGPKAAEGPKAAAIALINARPNAPGAKLLKTKFHITDAELAQ